MRSKISLVKGHNILSSDNDETQQQLTDLTATLHA